MQSVVALYFLWYRGQGNTLLTRKLTLDPLAQPEIVLTILKEMRDPHARVLASLLILKKCKPYCHCIQRHYQSIDKSRMHWVLSTSTPLESMVS